MEEGDGRSSWRDRGRKCSVRGRMSKRKRRSMTVGEEGERGGRLPSRKGRKGGKMAAIRV